MFCRFLYYRNLQNIYYYELPLRMGSDDEGTDSEYEWPSFALDCGRAMEAAVKDHEEHQKFVAEWVSAV